MPILGLIIHYVHINYDFSQKTPSLSRERQEGNLKLDTNLNNSDMTSGFGNNTNNNENINTNNTKNGVNVCVTSPDVIENYKNNSQKDFKRASMILFHTQT